MVNELRLITFNDNFPVEPGSLVASGPIFANLKILKVMDVFKLQTSKFVYKCIHHLTPINFHYWFQLNYTVHGYLTRFNYSLKESVVNKNNLVVPYARTSNYGFKQIKVNGSRIWNELPSHIKNAPSFGILVKLLKSHLISTYV